ncbi:MAG TPA: hypothetical protein P5248_12370, partial [Bacteroidales bacterium]|nr:hypothetical protein [Bacteroidales bacterium]
FNREVLQGRGFFFKTPEELAGQLTETVNTPYRGSWPEENRQHIVERYNWEGVIRTYHALFQRMLKL